MGDYPKLPVEFKNKWINNLRSGKFKQITGQLYVPEMYNTGILGHCCLGVGGCILGYNNDLMARSMLLTALSDIPQDIKKVMETLTNFKDNDGQYITIEVHLVLMNDQFKKTFPEIADWIEENL